MKKARPKKTTQTKLKSRVIKPDIPEAQRKNLPFKQILIYSCLAICLLFVIIVRSRLLDLPLERDEGEYALMGQHILKGIPPYEIAYNMKLPGTYYMYALVMAFFGQNASGIHLGLLLTNLTSILLLFFIGKKLVNETFALIAAISFALLSMSPGVFGFAAHATHFNVVFGLAGFLILLLYVERPTFLYLTLSGFCFGLSFIMKQQALFLMVFGLLSLCLIERKRKPFQLKDSIFRIGAFGVALVLPYLLVLLSAWVTGTFDKFWHWTVEYASQYVGIKNTGDRLTFLKRYWAYVTNGYILFWIVGLVGLGTLFFSNAARNHKWIIFMFAISSIACVIPGFYFRPHYFVVFLPALALLVAVALNFFQEQLLKWRLTWLGFLPFLFLGYMFFLSISKHNFTFFKIEPATLALNTYGYANPFRESEEIAKFIASNSTEQDKIAIIGSEPQIYFYSHRLPATGYIYTYALMENQPYSVEMTRDMIAEIEKNKPKFLIYINSAFSWLKTAESSLDIFHWNEKYQKDFYNMVGVVDIDPSGQSTFIWRDALIGYSVKNEVSVWVFERK